MDAKFSGNSTALEERIRAFARIMRYAVLRPAEHHWRLKGGFWGALNPNLVGHWIDCRIASEGSSEKVQLEASSRGIPLWGKAKALRIAEVHLLELAQFLQSGGSEAPPAPRFASASWRTTRWWPLTEASLSLGSFLGALLGCSLAGIGCLWLYGALLVKALDGAPPAELLSVPAPEGMVITGLDRIPWPTIFWAGSFVGMTAGLVLGLLAGLLLWSAECSLFLGRIPIESAIVLGLTTFLFTASWTSVPVAGELSLPVPTLPYAAYALLVSVLFPLLAYGAYSFLWSLRKERHGDR